MAFNAPNDLASIAAHGTSCPPLGNNSRPFPTFCGKSQLTIGTLGNAMTYPFTVKLYSSRSHACGRAGEEVLSVGLGQRWMADLEVEVAMKRSDIMLAKLLDHAAAKTEDYFAPVNGLPASSSSPGS